MPYCYCWDYCSDYTSVCLLHYVCIILLPISIPRFGHIQGHEATGLASKWHQTKAHCHALSWRIQKKRIKKQKTYVCLFKYDSLVVLLPLAFPVKVLLLDKGNREEALVVLQRSLFDRAYSMRPLQNEITANKLRLKQI